MKKILTILPLFLLCGCLSPVTVPAVSLWLMEFRGTPVEAAAPKYGIVRLSQVVVNQPYAGDSLVVLRRDGTVAFDPQNAFAASPTALLKNVGFTALKSSGLFPDVVISSSGAAAPVSAEIVVKRLALDCREEDVRKAVAEIRIRLLTGMMISATAEGEGVADASDGDYGAAFSKAVSEAFVSALSKIR